MIILTGDAAASGSESSEDVILPAQVFDDKHAAGDGVDELMIEIFS